MAPSNTGKSPRAAAAPGASASGAGGGRFNPDRLVTRQDMAVLIVNYANAMGLELPAVRPPRSFKDGGSISSYAKSAVDKCSRAGVINGDDNGNFRPGGYATRAEAASMYSRFLEIRWPALEMPG